ncbi:hypothetical protein M9H77_17323 [Catharanthus roseus]|uniref:Uncharacterized protein n=1 Tax=Catharanthus roseus TaxID=4058 RepID=A0ACC0B4A3_CATRO|nr:hypothetical protein M9H77_17323 [Catharanthus roseus]
MSIEEVPALVHPGPIVPDVFTMQHEHSSSLIWSGDHETCITDLQCRHFSRNLFQTYSKALRHMLPDMSVSLIHVWYISLLENFDAIGTYSWGSCGSFRGCMTDRESLCATSDLGLVAYSYIASTVRSACGTRPSWSTWCYVVHII